ncbi:hydroxyisourate hydrolase [Peterkaempfera bronchialis]|uniref:hydroxyisourate hydrolase n=1 Tax=Peterkaempfera bronchialis TaxID=2126346 RepID=UPI003C2D0E42
MTGISTHVLDTALGRPAEGVRVELSRQTEDGGWQLLAVSATDADGRCRDLPEVATGDAVLRLRFDTGGYLPGRPFFPEVSVVFTVAPDQSHYHVPLLLSPYGYSVYRGS